MSYHDEALAEILEDDDYDDAWDERKARSKSRPVSPARPNGAGALGRTPTSSATYVTQPQLQAALEKVGEQIGKNSSAIRALDQKAEARADRTDKALVAVRRDVKRSAEMAALLPMLTQKSMTRAELERDPDAKVLVAGDSLSAFLPLLMMGGLGSGGNGAGTEDNSMMMLVMAMALGDRSTSR